MRIATIWHTYGPYHLARVRALESAFGRDSVLCLSHRERDRVTYPFFNLNPANHQVISPGVSERVPFTRACVRSFWILRGAAPDLVLACGYERPETLGALIFSRMHGKKVFLMLNNQYDDRPRRFWVEFAKRVYLRLFDGFVYGGDTHRRYLRLLKVPPQREVTGYNCVDNQWIAREAAAQRASGIRLAPFARYFLCVARLVNKKNIPGVLEAYAAYRASPEIRDNPWGIVLVGDGPLRAAMEAEVDRLGIRGNVYFAGQVDDFSRVVNYHANAAALILASHSDEQWGLVVNEAMEAGKPVLVSMQCGCASSLVNEGENGFTFDARRVSQLAARMVWMHGNEFDLDRMGEASRRIVASFSPDRFASNVKHLYEAGTGLAGPGS